MSDPAIGAAFIGAVALLIAAIVALIPFLGVLHRLERVTAILERLDDTADRAPLVALRDRLIDRLRPRPAPVSFFFLAAIGAFLLAAITIGLGVALRTIWSDGTDAPASGPLVLFGVTIILVGLGFFLAALVNARTRRGPRRPLLPPARKTRKKR